MTKVLIINNEHDRNNLGMAPRIQNALTRGTETWFEILHYAEISRERIEEIQPDMIFLTGRLTYAGNLDAKKYIPELEMIRQTDIPILGICFGHQLISTAYGASLGKMIDVPAGEEDIREEGYVRINSCKQDELFRGIEGPFTAYEYHLEEVKEVPENFDLIASSAMCKVQAIRHREKDIYGFQFHPEGYNQDHPAGELILQNFFDKVRPQVAYSMPMSHEGIAFSPAK